VCPVGEVGYFMGLKKLADLVPEGDDGTPKSVNVPKHITILDDDGDDLPVSPKPRRRRRSQTGNIDPKDDDGTIVDDGNHDADNENMPRGGVKSVVPSASRKKGAGARDAHRALLAERARAEDDAIAARFQAGSTCQGKSHFQQVASSEGHLDTFDAADEDAPTQLPPEDVCKKAGEEGGSSCFFGAYNSLRGNAFMYAGRYTYGFATRPQRSRGGRGQGG